MRKRKKNLINKFKEREIWSVILFISSIIIFLSIITFDIERPLGINDDFPISNLLGKVGVFISYYLVTFTIGYFSIIIPLAMLIISYAIFFRKNLYSYLSKCLVLACLSFQLAILLARITDLYFPDFQYSSGYLGILISSYINTIFGELFFWLFIPISIVMLICIFFEISLYDLLILTSENIKGVYKKIEKLFHFIKRFVVQFAMPAISWIKNKSFKVEVNKPEDFKNEKTITQDFEPDINPNDIQKSNNTSSKLEDFKNDIDNAVNDSSDLGPIDDVDSNLFNEEIQRLGH